MRIERRKIADLKLAEYNPRKIGSKELKALKANLKRFGVVEPIVVNDNTGVVVGGHQRLEALKSLGETEVDVSVVDLNEADEMSLNVALNKVRADWDDEKLKGVLADLKTSFDDLEATGFVFEEKEVREGSLPDSVPSEMMQTTGTVMEKLFYNTEKHADIVAKIRDLSVFYSKENVTETIVAAVEDEYGR